LWSDLGIGIVYYRDLIHPISGWFHHILYTWVVYVALKEEMAGVFMAFCVLELPTLYVSVTSMFPHLYNSRVFAISYASTRIVLHAWLAMRSFQLFDSWIVWVPWIIWPIHIAWFGGWLVTKVKK
jgi:hypothetical protein